jgi:hypothetical protein
MTDARNRNWTELAEAACAEQDPEKLIRIVEELNRVLERQSGKDEQPGDPRNREERRSEYSTADPGYCF